MLEQKEERLMELKHMYLFILVIIMYGVNVYAIDIGSDFQLIRFTSKQILKHNDRIAAFTALRAGFSIDHPKAHVIFDSLFSVAGMIDLNGATIILESDLILENDALIVGLGHIIGNNHLIKLPCSIKKISTNQQEHVNITDVVIALEGNVELNNYVLHCKGHCVIEGKGNEITLGEGAAIIVHPHSVVEFKNITISGIQNDIVKCIDHSGHIICTNVEWIQDGTYIFHSGSLDIVQKLHIRGPGHRFIFNSCAPSKLTIHKNSELIIDHNHTLLYASESASKDLFVLTDSTSVIKLQGGILQAGSSGLCLKKGTLEVHAKSTLAAQGHAPETGIMIGDGVNLENNLAVHILPAAQLILQGAIVDNSI